MVHWLKRRRVGMLRAAVSFGLAALCIGTAVAAVPATVGVEGALYSSGGGPAADGTYALTFSLYKDAVAPASVWSESAQVTVKGGLFTHVLGASKVLDAATLNGAGASPFLGVKVDPDPEMPRKPVQSQLYALRAGSLDCSGCIGATQLDPTVLAPYAKSTSLSKAATSGNYSDLLGSPDLSVYAKLATLAKVASSGSYADLAGLPDLSVYAKVGNLANVAISGAYADLSGAPTVTVAFGSQCGTGFVVKGIKTDGSLLCIAAVDPSALPPDGLNEISNGLLTNQFTDTVAGLANVAIPDNNPVGASSPLVFPDLGVAQSIAVAVDITNSDLTKVKVSVFDPNNVEYVLFNGGAAGSSIKTSYPDKTKTVSGDLTSWIGKNPQGNWYLKVVDTGFLNNAKDGAINAWGITIGTLSSKKIQIKGNVSADGNFVVAGTLASAGDLTVAGGPVLSNFKYVPINNDFRNNSSSVTAGTWADIPARTLTYTKTREGSLIRIQYADTLGTYGTDYGQCQWRILVDGNQITSFSAADISYGLAWRMQNATHSAIAVGYKAGAHTIKVQTYRTGATECLMGWNTGGNYLSAEEVGP
jgi:subtilisin-like proprotein convertase family protein